MSDPISPSMQRSIDSLNALRASERASEERRRQREMAVGIATMLDRINNGPMFHFAAPVWVLSVIPTADGRWYCSLCGVVGPEQYLLHRKVCPIRVA